MGNVSFSVFTKLWKSQSVDELGEYVSNAGFDGIEFPLRPGYQVEPQNAVKGLPELVKKLEKYSVKVTSVASSLDEVVFAGCCEAGIPVIRIMGSYGLDRNYMDFEGEMREKLDSILPFCQKYDVKVGIQHHYGPGLSNAMELRHLIEGYDPKYIGAIWDAAHSGLAGEEPEQGLDIVWSHLCMVNLKNGFYIRTNGPEAKQAEWERYFTLGSQGLASWPRIASHLKNREYKGTLCLTAEYTDEKKVQELCLQDISYAKCLFI